jgi:uncharacterized protein (TIGR02246 family)
MRFLLSLLIAAVLVPPIYAQSLEDEEDAIRAVWARFEQFVENGDAEGIASLYALDSDRFASVSQKAVGRAEVLEQYRAVISARDADETTIRPFHADITIRFLRADVAIADGVYDVRLGVTGYFTVILTYEDGQWWIVAGRPRGSVQQ